jgi:hypothetical protein
VTDIGPHLLGRTVEHPVANRAFPYPQRTVAKPVSVTWPTSAPILDQGNVGSCEGNTAIEWLNCDIAVKNRVRSTFQPKMTAKQFLREADAVKAYSKATELDDDGVATKYPPSDTGTSAVGIAKAMQFYKAIDQYTWSFGWDHFVAAIQNQPVMLGTNWYSGMFNPDRKGYVEISGDVAGGHAYLARGIDYQNQRVLCRNHWGAQWGIKGEFWLRFPTLQRLLKEQGDVLVPTLLT